MSLNSPVLFSCKLSHSLISYLDRRGEDLELLYEKFDWPTEFLRDPSCWLEADKMESLLRLMEKDYAHAVHTDPLNDSGSEFSGSALSVSNSAALDHSLHGSSHGQDALIVAVGHQCKDLRSWGVLDSVLRMVQTSKDLFAQPERFLSYFVSPAPPIGDLKREADSVSFVLPISEIRFPLVTAYLRAALEALPTYISKPMATVTWRESRVRIVWSERQVSLFSDAENKELTLHPELVRNILMNLESSQTELELAKKSLIERDLEIERLKKALSRQISMVVAQPSLMDGLRANALLVENRHEALNGARDEGQGETSARLSPPPTHPISADSGIVFETGPVGGSVSGSVSSSSSGVPWAARANSVNQVLTSNDVDLSALAHALGEEIEKPVAELLNELYRTGDYMARGQQLITLLIGQGRQTPQVQQAMRRVDWSFVAGEGPKLIKRVIRSLQGLQETSQDLFHLADLRRALSTQTGVELLRQRVPSDLNRLVERAIANVSARDSKLLAGQVHIDCQLSLNQNVAVLPTRIEQAVTNLLWSTLDAVEAGGRIQISTRPRGGRAEILISDDGNGWDETSMALFNSPLSESADLIFAKTGRASPRLGLALAQSIIRLHEGGVTVSHEPGLGATILVDLPFA